ncbi:MAG: hypothetical protein QM811_02090 [Pirellulales bacterium]
MLREEYAGLLARMTPEHPVLRELSGEIEAADRRLREKTSQVVETIDAGDSNVRIVPNQYFRTAALPKTAPQSTEPNPRIVQGLSELEQQFLILRSETETLLAAVERERSAAPPTDDPLRSAAWQAVTKRLLDLEEHCRLPPSVQSLPVRAVAPTSLGSSYLWSALLLGLLAGCATWKLRAVARASTASSHPSPSGRSSDFARNDVIDPLARRDRAHVGLRTAGRVAYRCRTRYAAAFAYRVG